MNIIDIKVTMNTLDILHRSENDIVITTKRRLIKDDQKIILNTSNNDF
tara:strand:+ start:727 stop:870 length:144 start_codon:yes stop_codon:yes gene_type:complete